MTDKTAEEILREKDTFTITVSGRKLYQRKNVLEALDQYGQQCFEAARENQNTEPSSKPITFPQFVASQFPKFKYYSDYCEQLKKK